MQMKPKRLRFKYRATFPGGSSITFETADDPTEILPNAIDIKTIGIAPSFDYPLGARLVCKNRMLGVTE